MELNHDRLIEQKQSQQNQTITKLLIADDDPPTRILLRAAVSQWGYEVVEVGNGQEAWDALQQADAPRLLVLDWLMPKIDGISLCSRIRKEIPYFHYIILLTQVSGTTNIIKGLEAGADEFLSKPFNMAELRSRLSVGSRIIKYEKAIVSQRNELQKNITQTVTLAALLLNITQKIDEILKINDDHKNIIKNEENISKIQELRSGLTHILDVIKNFQSDSKQ